MVPCCSLEPSRAQAARCRHYGGRLQQGLLVWLPQLPPPCRVRFESFLPTAPCCSCEPPRAQAARRGRYYLLLVRAAKGSSSMAWPWRRRLGSAKSHHACRWSSNAWVPWRCSWSLCFGSCGYRVSESSWRKLSSIFRADDGDALGRRSPSWRRRRSALLPLMTAAVCGGTLPVHHQVTYKILRAIPPLMVLKIFIV